MKRVDRLAPFIQREISEIIQRKIKDPRVGFCTVTRVELSNDLRVAKVWVSVMGGENRKRECLEGLKRATGFIRSELGQSLSVRYTPEIRFFIDKSIDHMMKVDRLLKSIQDELHPDTEDETK
ncbi:TPA: 30S ribosome-binding factor RbfA [Candidatus Poribacteria bacterium]|nr:30S ribosome-binding factor RbfA [Candidatus Poribacteria bacterium]